jgi:hypothetical protein
MLLAGACDDLESDRRFQTAAIQRDFRARGQTRYLFCVEFHDLCASVLSFAPRFDRNCPGARKAALHGTMHESVCPLTKKGFFPWVGEMASTC